MARAQRRKSEEKAREEMRRKKAKEEKVSKKEMQVCEKVVIPLKTVFSNDLWLQNIEKEAR